MWVVRKEQKGQSRLDKPRATPRKRVKHISKAVGFLGDLISKESACSAETLVLSVGWENPLEK